MTTIASLLFVAERLAERLAAVEADDDGKP
jgi:hypothetical protein